MAVSMHQTARTIALASLPPGTSPAETRRLLRERFYPELRVEDGEPGAQGAEPGPKH